MGVELRVKPRTETEGPGEPGREDDTLEDDNAVEERVLGGGRCCCCCCDIWEEPGRSGANTSPRRTSSRDSPVDYDALFAMVSCDCEVEEIERSNLYLSLHAT